mgnify:CR=1 FL=1
MIIIEGPDGAGKSTLVQYIKKETTFGVLKPYYPKVNQLAYYLHTPPMYYGYFLERYYLSELAYPQFKGDREVMVPWGQFQIEAAMLPYAPVIFYLRPDRETIIRNIKTRGDDYVDENDVDRMLQVYDSIVEKSFLPVVRYDFEKDDVALKIEEAVNKHITADSYCIDLRGYLYTGSVKRDGIMIIGDEPSDKSVGNGYIKGFLSDKGSSAFLHRALYEAGIYEHTMPYFTNWGKGFDNDEDRMRALKEEIDAIQPRKIITMGKDVTQKTGIGGGELEHPSYVKRFSSTNYQWYIDKIKNLMK